MTTQQWPDIPSNGTWNLIPLLEGLNKSEDKNLLPFTKLNQSPNVFVDISSEEWREYTFPGGNTIKVERPTHLSVGTSGHRLLDESGFSHYIPKGWIHLKWLVKKGQPHFVK